MPVTERKPLHPLPLLPFLVASPHRTLPPLKLKDRDMSLLPSPFLASTSSATPRTAHVPLATLYDAPSPRRPDASTSRLGSPSRVMMDDDDAQNRAEDELPVSSPRRLLDAFLHAASPGKARRAASMLPPQSPRWAVALSRGEEQVSPIWSFYEDTPDASFAPSTPPVPSIPSAPPEDATADDMAPVDKENSRPPPRLCRLSTSVAPPTPSVPASPVPAPVTTMGTPRSPPRTPPGASSAAAAFFSPSLAFSHTPSGGSAAGASYFGEGGPTTFASASIGDAEGGFGRLLPAFEAGAREPRGKKRESLEGPGSAIGAKRARCTEEALEGTREA